MLGIEIARLFEPRDRLVGARLQQMDDANPEIPDTEQIIARAETDGLLVQRDCILDQARLKLAPAQRGYGEQPIAVGRPRPRLLDPVLCVQEETFRQVRMRVAR